MFPAIHNNSAHYVASEYAPQLENIGFLDVVKIKWIVCPLSKNFLLDAVQLVPCGHHFNKAALKAWYFKNRAKICPLPTCEQPYKFTQDNQLIQEIATSFDRKIKQPNQKLKEKFLEFKQTLLADQTLPETEKQEIATAIEDFLNDGDVKSVETMTNVMMNSRHENIYSPIFDLMNDHIKNVAHQRERWIQEIFETKTECVQELIPQEPLLESSSQASYPYSDIVSESSGTSNSDQTIEAHVMELNQGSKKSEESEYTFDHSDDGELTDDSYYELSKKRKRKDTFAYGLEEYEYPEPVAKRLRTKKSVANTTSEYRENTQAGKKLIEEIKKKSKKVSFAIESANLNDLNTQDEQTGNKPMHLIVLCYDNETAQGHLQRLYAKGARVDAQNFAGETPLHLAVQQDKPPIISQLITLGASNLIKDNNKRVPSDYLKSDYAKQMFATFQQ